MNSAVAHGWLIAGFINDHLFDKWYGDAWDGMPEGSTVYCPECCGPCGAWRDYFATPRGRAEADTYVRALPGGAGNYSWMTQDQGIDWHVIEAWMKLGFCPNHEEK